MWLRTFGWVVKGAAFAALALLAVPCMQAADRVVSKSAAPKPRATPAAKGRAAAAAPALQPRELSRNALSLEEIGAYDRALEELKRMRPLVQRDPDLEFEIALLFARTDRWDSAAAILWSLPISAAELDSQPLGLRHDYPWERESLWSDGAFQGWNWNVWRARAEVAAHDGKWSDALQAQTRALKQRECSGKEWILLGECQAHLGGWDEAERSFLRGIELDPTLPEGHYLLGLCHWRARRAAAASQAFAKALALDSLFREAALARTKLRLGPAVASDSLPSWLLQGRSATALLTSTQRPKLTEFVQIDSPPLPVSISLPHYPPGTASDKPHSVELEVLIDERGRVVLHELPYLDPGTWPDPLVHALTAEISHWQFSVPIKSGSPVAAWTAVRAEFQR